MRIYGTFKDLADNTISVDIYNPNEMGDYPIDDHFYTDQSHPTWGHFCFDGSKPVIIKHNCSDLFEPIISTSCKIKLRTDIWCGKLLFTEGAGDIVVKVTRTLNVQNASEKTIFVGFVTPLSFSQNINKHDNVIDINCKDLLGFMKDTYLSTGTLSAANTSAWKIALANSIYRPIAGRVNPADPDVSIMHRLGLYGYDFDFDDYNEYTSLFIDNNGKNSMATTLYISDNLWLGESADDEMPMQEILLELLKYMNCRLISTNGLDFYIIANNNTGSTTNYKHYFSDCRTADETVTASQLPKANIANEKVTIDDCFNRIGVKCELETIDDVVQNILDDENLYSDYNNKQLFMTELAAPSQHALYVMIRNNGIPIRQIDTDELPKCWYKNWYLRVMKSTCWNLKNNFESNMTFDGGASYVVQDQYGAWINQQKSVYDLGQTRIGNPSNPPRLGAYIVQYGSGDKHSIQDVQEDGNVSTESALIIPVNGLWADGRPNESTAPSDAQQRTAEAGAMISWANYLQQYDIDPMVEYDGTSSMNLKPADSNTKNYIIISGSLTCTPRLISTKHYNTENGDVIGISSNFSARQAASASESSFVKTTAYVDENARYYYHNIFDKTYTNTGDKTKSTVTLTSVWRPYIEVEKLKDFKYNGYTNKSSAVADRINKLPILCCRLSVGGMYVQENIDASGNSTYTWTSDSSATFTIGVNPAVNDYIIGKKWEIKNDISVAMNLDEEGLAIPITYNDNIHGKLHFEILGPYNTMWEKTTYETHCKISQWWNGYPAEEWNYTNYSLLNHISSIVIDKFEIKVATDNAKNATLNAGDLMYYSEDDKKYNNPKDDIEFKIVTALTSEEGAKMNVATGVSFNNPTLGGTGNLYTTNDQNKPEVQYVTTMWQLYSTPKKMIEYKCDYNDNNITSLYATVFTNCDLMSHLDEPDFPTIILNDELDLKNNRMKITMREHTFNPIQNI